MLTTQMIEVGSAAYMHSLARKMRGLKIPQVLATVHHGLHPKAIVTECLAVGHPVTKPAAAVNPMLGAILVRTKLLFHGSIMRLTLAVPPSLS